MNYLPEDFMDRVVVWPGASDAPGFINFHWLPPAERGNGMRGKPFKDHREFMNFAQYAVGKPSIYKEIFFCLSTQKSTGKTVHGRATAHRHASQALFLKALWLDVDVKAEKGYGTRSEAVASIFKFCKDANLPPPSAIVYSGGGVHTYWISDAPLTEPQWRPYAEGLKMETLRLGLKCDAGLTTDPARVLRVPGTFNNKIPGQPRVVKLAHLGTSYNFSASLGTLATLAPVREASSPSVTATETTRPTVTTFAVSWEPTPGFPDPTDDNLSAGIGGNSRLDLPLLPGEVIKGCAHFQEAATTHGKGHGQGLWSLTLLASSFLEDGRRWARYFSKGYPTYDRGETDAKYDEKLRAKTERNLGWPSCKAFEAEGAKCKTCPFYGTIRSPLALAERASPPADEVVAPPTIVDAELDLPAGFVLNADGVICIVQQKKLENKITIEEHIPLFHSKLRNFKAKAGNRSLEFETSLDAGRWGRVSVSERTDFITEQTMVRALRHGGVLPMVPNQKHLVHFMTSFLAKLDAAKAREQSSHYGWMFPEAGGSLAIGFSYGGIVFNADGTEGMAGPTDSQLELLYTPKGKIEHWYECCKMVTDQHHPALEVTILSSFAAPLMRFTGKYNVALCPWSPKAGTHKSTSIAIGAGVWGHPKLTKERPISSQKGIFLKMGHLNNLPIYWDEISDSDKMDEVRLILGYLTEGAEGSKSKSDRTLHDIRGWQTMMLVGANVSLVDNIMSNVSKTDAQLQRVFEYEVEQRPDTAHEHEISNMIGELDNNYGHMGLKYSKLLAMNQERIQKLINATEKKLRLAAPSTSDERFRTASVITIYVAALLANECGAEFNTKEIWKFMVDEFRSQQQIIASSNIVAGSATNTTNALTQFLKSVTRNVLWVDTMPSGKRGRPGAITYRAGPCTAHPDPVHVRVAVNDRQMQISKKHLEKYLMSPGVKHSTGVVIGSLKKVFNATIVDRVDLSQGATVMGSRETVIQIPIPPHSPFEDILFKHLPIDGRQPGDVTVAETGIEEAKTPNQKFGDVLNAAIGQAKADHKSLEGVEGA